MAQISVAAEIGGGEAYAHKVPRSQATKVVESRSALLSALKGASSNDVIYVPGDASIDCTGVSSAPIGADGVVLASDRGINGSDGGLIHADNMSSANTRGVFKTSRSNVRVTGLRWRGPRTDRFHPGTGNWHSNGAEAIHISKGGNNWEVDNCEMYGWPGQCLNIWGDKCHIHNCYMRKNQMSGLGYGAELQVGHHFFTCNVFDECRHDIAATGRPGNGYTARQNVFGITNNEYGHAADMHGYPNGGDRAGDKIIIEQNTFMRRPPRSGASRREKDGGVHIRGVPADKCVVRGNLFRHPNKPSGTGGRYEAIWQSNVGSSFKNMSVSGNSYGLGNAAPGVGAASGQKTLTFP